MSSIKKYLSHLLTAALLVAVFIPSLQKDAFADFPTTVPTVAEGFVIYDATAGQVILGKQENTKFYPASITKIMTGLLACERIPDMSAPIAFAPEAIAELTPRSSTLVPAAVTGEIMTLNDVLYGMFYVSANECAAQLGITVGGTTAAFAELMNQRAQQIGCKSTHFVNAHGLHDDNHYSTPYDMALIMAEALRNEKFFKMATGKNYTIPATNGCATAREMTISHQICSGAIPYQEVFAGKTGRTPEALRTLVTAAQFNGHTVIVVIMKSSDEAFYDDTLKLLEYARGYCNGRYTSMTWEPKDETIYVTGTNSLKVRDYPAQSGSKVVGNLTYGQQVKRTGTWGDWSQINYMGTLLYVHSDYVTTTPPNAESMEVVTTTPREVESIDFSSISISTAAETTVDIPSTAAPASIDVVEDVTDPNAPSSSADKKGATDMQEGPIKTLMIVCVVLMVVLAAAAVVYNLNMRHKRKKRREMRRRHRGDEFWK
ncbi:MAG: SH3 domain-containing protein [Lachnospiraceae bacterium]|nr:SH3 domain-containing protein [Lachnospiraceae bacterium]